VGVVIFCIVCQKTTFTFTDGDRRTDGHGQTSTSLLEAPNVLRRLNKPVGLKHNQRSASRSFLAVTSVCQARSEKTGSRIVNCMQL